MTTQTNIDYLFQVTASLAERGPAGPELDDATPTAFDAHLAEAGESARGGSSLNTSDGQGSADRFSPVDYRPPVRPSIDDSYTSPKSTNDANYAECSASCPDEQPMAHGDGSAVSEEDAVEAGVGSASGLASTQADDSDSMGSNASDEVGLADAEGPHDFVLSEANAAITSSTDTVTTGIEPAAHPVETQAAAGSEDTGEESQPANGSFNSTPMACHAMASGHGEDGTSKSNINFQRQAAELTHGGRVSSTGADVAVVQPPEAAANVVSASATSGRHEHSSPTSQGGTSGTGHDAKTVQAAARVPISGKPTSEQVTTADRRTSNNGKKSEDPRRGSKDSAESRSAQRGDPTAISVKPTAVAIAQAATGDPANVHSTDATEESNRTTAQSTRTKGDVLAHSIARLNRANGATGRGARTETASALPRVDATRFVGRVAKAIQTASERGGPLQLRLSPPELGSLRLELTVENGVMSATLETESSTAKQVLLDHLPALRDRLADQNIRIERFDVDVRQEGGSGGGSDPRGSQQERPGEQPQYTTLRQEAARANVNEGSSSDAPNRTRSGNSEINVLA
jgi:flagellar hook-length control protein FliK